MQYKIYYDILQSGSGAEGEIFGFLICIIGAVFLLVRSLGRQKPFQTKFVIIWFIFFVGLGSLGLGNVYYQHYRCLQWARSGDYKIAEGSVTNFVKYNRAVYEQFSAKNVHFEYSSYNLSACGFKQLVSEGSPIQDGLQVRIAYRDGKILKLEIAENQ